MYVFRVNSRDTFATTLILEVNQRILKEILLENFMNEKKIDVMEEYHCSGEILLKYVKCSNRTIDIK